MITAMSRVSAEMRRARGQLGIVAEHEAIILDRRPATRLIRVDRLLE
jgi:hypothetical protein